VTAFSRGDICLVDFNPAKGGEIGKLRPAVIISSEEEIAMLATVIVIPLSTVIEPNTFPYRYTITQRGELHQDSDACIYEVRALSKERIKTKLCTLHPEELSKVIQGLCQIVH